MLGDAYSQGLHSMPKCILKTLVTKGMRVDLSDYNPALISMTMLMIFPAMNKFIWSSPEWSRLEVLVGVLGQVRDMAVLTEHLMRCLDEVREQPVGNPGIPVYPAVSSCLSLGSTGERGWAYPVIDVTLRSFPQEEIAQTFCGPFSRFLDTV